MASNVLLSVSSKPLSPTIILCGWGNGKMRQLIKYKEIFENQDVNTICVTTNLARVAFDSIRTTNYYRDQILQCLEDASIRERSSNQVILMPFCQAGSHTMANLIMYMEKEKSLPFKVIGSIFDSGPILSKSLVSCTPRAIWNSYRRTPSTLMRRVVDGAISALINRHMRFHQLCDTVLRDFDSQAPQLFLCSSADSIMEVKDILELSELRKKKGVPVQVKMWDDCDHVQLLRGHPEEYKAVVNDFVNLCVENAKMLPAFENAKMLPAFDNLRHPDLTISNLSHL